MKNGMEKKKNMMRNNIKETESHTKKIKKNTMATTTPKRDPMEDKESSKNPRLSSTSYVYFGYC